MLMNDLQSTKIKICGLTRPEDMEYLMEANVDYAGFVFAASRRQVLPEEAAVLTTRLSQAIRTVGVFVNATVSEIIRTMEQVRLDIVQLHGDETIQFIRQLRRSSPVPIEIWKQKSFDALHQPAIQLTEQANCIKTKDNPRERNDERLLPMDRSLLSQSAHDEQPDAWLLDSAIPGSSGGTGRSFDWSLAAGLSHHHRIVLAGGLNAENVCMAILTVHPEVVDCSSSVEKNGWKDRDRIMEFCRRVREADCHAR